jgi:BioD-like phosphotransacetylase family protein
MRETFDPMLIVTGADLVDVFLAAMLLGMVWLLAFLPHERGA